MNYGTAIGGESESPNYYNNQVGVCFAAYRNLPHLVRARIVWCAAAATRPHSRLQPCVLGAATLCARSCDPVC